MRTHLDRAATQHLPAQVSAVIAAKQEAPSLGDVIDRTRRYVGEVVVVVGRSTDGTAVVAADGGARVLHDGGVGKGEALRRAIPLIRTPVTVFLDADGSHDPEDIPLLVEPITADRADHVTASRLRGGSSELHGGFDEFLRLAGSSFITACINWRFNCQIERQPERLPRCAHQPVARAEPAREHHHYRAGDDHQDLARRLPHGRSAQPRASPPAWLLAHPRLAHCAPLRLFASEVPVLLNDASASGQPAVNILGIWDGHDSGAALLQDGRIVFAVNEERLSRRKLEVAFPDRSIAACLGHAGLRPDQIDIVAASTSDPAKTLGRVWPATKERYYNVRRRKAFPGPLASLTRSLKYRLTEWAPGPISRTVERAHPEGPSRATRVRAHRASTRRSS